jgi:hypothetical protein
MNRIENRLEVNLKALGFNPEIGDLTYDIMLPRDYTTNEQTEHLFTKFVVRTAVWLTVSLRRIHYS